MRGPGILWMLQTAAGFSMAGPMFFLGINAVLSGEYVWGVAFLSFGALVCYFPTYLVNRIGGPRAWIRRRLGRDGSSATEPTDGTGSDGSSATESADGARSDADETSTGLLERFRRR